MLNNAAARIVEYGNRMVEYGNRITAPFPSDFEYWEKVDAMMDRLEIMAEDLLHRWPALRVYRNFNMALFKKVPLTMTMALGFNVGWTSAIAAVFGLTAARLTEHELHELADGLFLAFDRQADAARLSLSEWFETGSPEYVMRCQLRRTAERLVDQMERNV